MNSFGTVSIVFFLFFTITNALDCRPVTCMLACPFGFNDDANGCPHCSCRVTPKYCIEPIYGYNCGTIDHRDCPSTHECQLSFSGMTGQCCLKPLGATIGQTTTGTTTGRPTTGTTTARPTTGTTTRHHTSTHRALHRLFSTGATSSVQGSTYSSPGTTVVTPINTSSSGSPVPTTSLPPTSTRY